VLDFNWLYSISCQSRELDKAVFKQLLARSQQDLEEASDVHTTLFMRQPCGKMA